MPIFVAVLLPVVVLFLWRSFPLLLIKAQKHRLPPGPSGEFLLGHLRVVPTDNPEYAYAEWSKQYKSDVLSFNILGQPVIVLNSVKAASELLEKRGANYSDRPRFVLFEIMGWGKILSFMRWGKRFRMHRKAIQSSFTPAKCIAYREIQQREARLAIARIMRSPDDWELLLRRFATAVILGIGFGVNIADDNDAYIQMAADASYALGHGGAPAGTLVDFFPFVRYLPNWLVRSRTLKFARDWRWAIKKIHDVPFSALQQKMAEGKAEPCFVRNLLDDRSTSISIKKQDHQQAIMELEDIKGVGAAIYAAGQDTTWSTLVVFVLCMLLNPEVQKKAQAEIDSVVGRDRRLPDFGDRPSLPYIDLIVQETLRWAPVSPLGLPHRSLKDDVYKDMFIPKGNSFVYANGRAMLHDPNTYKDPDTFNPDRYRPAADGGAGEPLPIGQFGFGRRVCPGQHLAEASIWIVAVTVLATMDINKARDMDGNLITPPVSLTNGLTSHPERFPCIWSPRSNLADKLSDI